MREITTHKVAGVETPRIFAVDAADPDAGGMHHVYAIIWDQSDLEDVEDFVQVFDPDLATYDGFHVLDAAEETIIGCLIKYQHGPVKEAGANGLHGECLRAIEIDRLESAQAGPFACRENALARTKLEESLMWGQQRTRRRRDAGAEGQNVRAKGDYDGR